MEIIINHIFLLINMLFFLFLSAFFSGTETAFFSLTRFQLKELAKDNKASSKVIIFLHKNPSKLLISVLLGNMTVNIFFFCLSAVFISKVSITNNETYFQIIFGILMLLAVIIFGEILPKAFGIKNPLVIARMSCYPIFIWQKISTPLRILVTLISSKFEPKPHSRKIKIKPEELRMLLKISKESGGIINEAGEIIDDIINLSSLRIKHIMTPRVDVVQCSKNEKIENAAKLAVKHKVFYLPVYENTKDNPIGYVLTKDIIFEQQIDIKSLVDFLKKPIFVPETKKAAELLTEMINNKFKMAFVVDEYGGLAGKITIDDILEEIVGEFYTSDFDSKLSPVQKIDKKTYRIQAGFLLNDWSDIFSYPLENEGVCSVSTLGGFITCLLGKVPEQGDTVKYRNLVFTVEEIVNRRLKSIILKIN